MPPRLSLRRLFLYIIGCGCIVIVLTNVLQIWPRWTSTTITSSDNSAPGIENQEEIGERKDNNKNTGNVITHLSTTNAHKKHNNIILKKQDDGDSNEVPQYFNEKELTKEKLWFMAGGTIRPSPAEKNRYTPFS